MIKVLMMESSLGIGGQEKISIELSQLDRDLVRTDFLVAGDDTGPLRKVLEERQFRISICQQIEIVSEVPAVTRGIPSNRAVWLREVANTVTVEVALFPAIAGMVRTKPSCSNNGGTISSNVKPVRINDFPVNRFIQEASTENLEQQTVGFHIYAEGSL